MCCIYINIIFIIYVSYNINIYIPETATDPCFVWSLDLVLEGSRINNGGRTHRFQVFTVDFYVKLRQTPSLKLAVRP